MILVHSRLYTLEYRKCCSTKHGRRMLYTVLLHPNYSQYCSTPITPTMGRMTDPLFIVTSFSNGWLQVVFQQEQGIFLFSKPSRLTIGPTKPPFPWVLPVAPSLALSSQGMRMTAHLHLAPRLKMSAATLCLYIISWRGQGLLYQYLS